MEDNDKQEILSAINSVADQTRELKEGRTEILEAVGLLADQMQEIRFDMDEMKVDVRGLKTDVSGLKTDVSGLKTDVSGLKADVRQMKATMVTKDYLDDKLADLHSDIVNFVKKRVPCWSESGI